MFSEGRERVHWERVGEKQVYYMLLVLSSYWKYTKTPSNDQNLVGQGGRELEKHHSSFAYFAFYFDTSLLKSSFQI